VTFIHDYGIIFQFSDMRRNPRIFKENFHVTPSQFDYLLELIRSKLEPKVNTRPEDSISPEERLCVTLE
jgi:hypothetical protein